MSNANFLGLALTSIQATLQSDLLGDLQSARHREYAACAARILARLRTDAQSAPDLARCHLDTWRGLANKAVNVDTVDPVAALHAYAADVCARLDARGANPEDAEWFRQVVGETSAYLSGYEQAVSSAHFSKPPEPVSGETPVKRLGDYLQSKFPALPNDPIVSLRIVPGGRTMQTSLFELKANSVLPTRLVLRRDLSFSVTGSSAYAEFPLLKELEARGLPIPSPIIAEKDPKHLGGSFIIMTEVVGATRGGELFAELNDLRALDSSFAVELVKALARLHGLSSHPSNTGPISDATGSTDAGAMVRNFRQMFDAIKCKPALHVASNLGFAWLLAHPLKADRPRRLVHGDLGLHNILVRDGKLAAILDWELAHIGDPAEDIAYAWAPLLRHLMSWEAFKKIYVDHGGTEAACDEAAIAWYSVWAHTRNSVYVATHYDWAAQGQRSDIECFNAGIDFFARTQHYIAMELEAALRITGSSPEET